MRNLACLSLFFFFLSNSASAQFHHWGLSTNRIGYNSAELGFSVDLNIDGNIMAYSSPNEIKANSWLNAGAVRIFQNDGQYLSGHLQIGQTLYGDSDYERFGEAIQLSGDGKTIIISAPWYLDDQQLSGRVKVYKYFNDRWYQKGQVLLPFNTGEIFGQSVSISEDGNTIAIGSNRISNNLPNQGEVVVYGWKNEEWQLIGSPIYGELQSECLVSKLELTPDGKTIVVASHETNFSFPDTARVKVYDLIGQNWTKRGNTFKGRKQDFYGSDIAIDKTGNKLFIASEKGDEIGVSTDCGSIESFVWNGSEWESLCPIVYGDSASMRLGRDFDISQDGTKMIASSTASNAGGSFGGRVGTFLFEPTIGWEILSDSTSFGLISTNARSVAMSAGGSNIIVSQNFNYNDGLISLYEAVCLFDADIETSACDQFYYDHAYMPNLLSDTTIDSIAINNSYIPVCNIFSTLQLDLSIRNSFQQIDTTSCDPFQWIDGNYYSASEPAPFLFFVNNEGCDSVYSLVFKDLVKAEIRQEAATLIANDSVESYQWVWCISNNPVEGENNRTFTPSIKGTYRVEIRSEGCIDTSDCINVSNVGIDDLIAQPNVVDFYYDELNHQLILQNKKSIPAMVELYDAQGALLLQRNISAKGRLSLMLDLPAQLIIVRATSSDNQSESFKLMTLH